MISHRVLAATDGTVSSRRAELRRLAAATRLLIEGLVGTDAEEDVLTASADELEALAARFNAGTPRSLYDGVAESAMGAAEPGALFDHSPMIGRANPLSPPIAMAIVEGEVRATVTFGSAYEGPPGCVHGGYVAAAFDEVLGAAQTLSGRAGMTGTLTVRYERPTPLYAELRIEATFDRREDRKVFTSGRMYSGDTVTAQAQGLFISIDPDRFRRLREERDARLGRRT